MKTDEAGQIQSSSWLYVGFTLTGTGTTLLGCILPALSANWHMNDAHAGTLFAAQFSGSAFGALLVGKDYFKSLIRGHLLLIVASASIGHVAVSFGGVFFFLFGLGLGLNMTATSMFIGSQFSERRGAALSALNACWALGAILCPSLTSFWLKQYRLGQLFLAFSITILVVLLLALRYHADVRLGQPVRHSAENSHVSLPLMFVVATIAFLYVGVETSVSGWMTSYVHRLQATHDSWPPIAVSSFWAALLCGRATAPIILRRVSEAELLRASVAVAFLSVSLLLLSHTPLGTVLSAMVSGFALGPIYPLCMARALALAHDSPSTKWTFSISGLGGALLPWLTGRVSDHHHGSLAVGLTTSLCALGVMFFLQLVSTRTPPVVPG